MRSYVSVCALALVVGACSVSSPFDSTVVPGSALGAGTTTTPTTPTTSTTAIPADVQDSVTSFAYDPATQSLTISGISFDAEAIAVS